MTHYPDPRLPKPDPIANLRRAFATYAGNGRISAGFGITNLRRKVAGRTILLWRDAAGHEEGELARVTDDELEPVLMQLIAELHCLKAAPAQRKAAAGEKTKRAAA